MSFTRSARRRLLIWGGGCLLLLVVLCLLSWYDVTAVDRLDDALRFDPWYDGRDVLVAISKATDVLPMAVLSVVVAALLVLKRHQRAAILVVSSIALTMTATGLLKAVVARPRQVLDDPILVFTSGAMPSGHSAYAACAGALAVVLATLFVRKRPLRRLVAALAVLWAALIGADRLLLGVHTVTDVVAGYALGVGTVLVIAALFDPAPPLMRAEPLASPVMGAKKLACILNPIKVEDVEIFKAAVEKMAADAGFGPPDWYFTTVEDPGRSMAEEAAISGASLVLVCGGDGTVRTVCGELAGTGIPVGAVPAGTGNLLARNLDLPLYQRSAIDVALSGQDRAIDLVKITGDGISDGEHFLVMAGMGFDAAIMEGANEQLKAKIGWIAYVVSGLRNLMYPVVRVEISVDDGPWTKHRARTIVVGNVGNLQGGLPLLPDATIDDGTIDLVLIYPRRFLSWLRVVSRVLRRSDLSDETVTRMTGRTITVRAAAETPRQIDGDSIGAGREITCVCLPGKLLMRVPR